MTSKKIRLQILRNAKELIDTGYVDDRIFLYIGIFNENIGMDFFSDMIANIIIDDIKNYTRHVNKILKKDNEYYVNEIKEKNIYYLPLEILSNIPTPRFMCDIDSCININNEIKKHVNNIIGNEWKNRTNIEKKKMVLEIIKNDPSAYKELLKSYDNDKTELYDFENDSVGSVKLPEVIEKYFTTSHQLGEIIDINKFFDFFKNIIENTNAVILLNADGRLRPESYCQKLLHLVLLTYYKNNEIDISPECNSGRGCLDFKIVSTNQKFAIEVKKMSSSQIFHGIETQLPEYAKAENIQNLIYVIFDDVDDNSAKVDKINKINSIANSLPYHVKVVYIDAKIKKSASVYRKE